MRKLSSDTTIFSKRNADNFLNMSRFLNSVLFFSSIWCLCGALRPVNIAKCCNLDEFLTEENLCMKNESSSWDIRIYNGKYKRFDRNYTLPSHWKVKEGVWVNCTRPHRLTYYGKNYFPFLNGSLFSVDFDRLVHPDHYCLDYKAALICLNGPNDDLAENITHVLVKKCCGKNAIFTQSNSTCRTFKDDKNTYRIDVGPGKTMGAGFPPCEDNSLRVVGDLASSKIFDNGSILVNTFVLPAGGYCLEHILEHNSGETLFFSFLLKGSGKFGSPICTNGRPSLTRPIVFDQIKSN